MAIELFHNAMSTCSQKVRLPLAEKGVEWVDRPVDLLKNEQKKPEYLKLNPNGVVPTLVHNGRVIIESSIINEYIEDAFEGPSLVPAHPADRAYMRLWNRLVDERLHTANGALTLATVRRAIQQQRPLEEVMDELNATPDPAQRAGRVALFEQGVEAAECERAMGVLAGIFSKIEARVSDHEWLAGEAYSLADASVTPYVTRLEQIGMEWLWTEDLYPALGAWYGRIKARPSFNLAITKFMPNGMGDIFRNLAAPSMPKIRDVFQATRPTAAAS